MIDSHAMLGEETYLRLGPAELLRRMDAAGVDVAITRPMGAGLVVDHRAGNDLVLKAGPRIRGLATVNPWWGPDALDELARSRDLGAVGLFLDPARQGFFPDEPVARPVIERAVEYGWPVMMRTGTYVYADILALAEVARSFPEATFIAGFGGFADMWFEMPMAVRNASNLLIETSMIWGAAIKQVVETHGAERVLFGGAEPRNRYAVVLRTLDRLELDPTVRRAIVHDNAARVFGIGRAAP
ncbi:amidohydrolase family protein [Aquisphaera insulae]|uniref:amidohydrolase family protein n=1 Tax=Aquisphaera insulae TaxID=2712864 RepID=UPI0013ED0587|nr:amidohydrolase family protein [Aquisphaera insulae]